LCEGNRQGQPLGISHDLERYLNESPREIFQFPGLPIYIVVGADIVSLDSTGSIITGALDLYGLADD